ncbi:MAG: NAD-dependent deacylase [bacterium]
MMTLVEQMLDSKSICVLTGAGVSKESGVPTFRDEDGLWNKFRPEELANVQAFLSNPKLVWEWYDWRRKLMAEVSPNPGHKALAELELLFTHFVLITQNVDNLHREAGSRDIIELHGNIRRNKCFDCHVVFETDSSESNDEFTSGELPKCLVCGGRLRPDVVWFGENLPEEALNRAWSESERCDIFFSIGTSAVVYPAAALPQVAKSSGAFLVEINPKPTELSSLADIVFQGASGEILPKIVAALKDNRREEQP